jgi:hypothetical protein
MNGAKFTEGREKNVKGVKAKLWQKNWVKERHIFAQFAKNKQGHKKQKNMTKKEFFTKKIIPQLEEQIFSYEFQLIRNQYILERLKKELEELEKSPIFQVGEDVEKTLKERTKRKREIQEQIEELTKNISLLPLIKEEEEKFLNHFKQIVEQL